MLWHMADRSRCNSTGRTRRCGLLKKRKGAAMVTNRTVSGQRLLCRPQVQWAVWSPVAGRPQHPLRQEAQVSRWVLLSEAKTWRVRLLNSKSWRPSQGVSRVSMEQKPKLSGTICLHRQRIMHLIWRCETLHKEHRELSRCNCQRKHFDPRDM
jgi:hypothetical protein